MAEMKDPVCGMMIDNESIWADYEGTKYYFCSEADRDAFKQDPKKYIEAAA